MKKETIMAIGIGFLLGFIVAFIFISLPSITKNGFQFTWKLPRFSLGPSRNTPKNNIPPTPTPVQTLTIASPTNESIAPNKTITIKGKAPAGATIIINTYTADIATKAQTDGAYRADIALSEGSNYIQVTSIQDNNQMPDTKNILVSYTSEKL